MYDAPLDPAAITAALQTRWLARNLHYLPETDSTNDTLQELALAGAPVGTMVITDYQRRGKGRMQRSWESPARASLLFSMLFRPQWPVQRAQWLTMLAGLAVAEAIEAESGLEVGLKWPNDVMLRRGEQWRKVCGLLLVTSLKGDEIEHAVIGIGLNVNIPAKGMPATVSPATSLLIAGGSPLPRIPLLARILHRLEQRYEAAEQGVSPQPEWNERLILLGRAVQVTGGPNNISGVVTGTSPRGELLLRDDAGKVHSIVAGDVTLRE
jgi:BirA family biotin operon repressor/biotin-[acetyl-CoA-carboxylase] ligase